MPTETIEMERLLQKKLGACQSLKSIIRDVADNQYGSVWAPEQVDRIEKYFAGLKALDKGLMSLKNAEINLGQESKLLNLVDDIRKTMLESKRLLTIYSARLEGGRHLVKSEINNVLRGKNIKGYRNLAQANSRGCLG